MKAMPRDFFVCTATALSAVRRNRCRSTSWSTPAVRVAAPTAGRAGDQRNHDKSSKYADQSIASRGKRRRLAAGSAKQPRLDFRIRWLGAQPDGEERLGEVIAFENSPHSAVHIHLNARAWFVSEG